MALDKKFTDAMQAWLDKSGTADILEGAMLLLRLNRNRAMYQQITRRLLRDKLIYELKKFLKIRLDGHTREDVARIEEQTTEKVQEDVEQARPETDSNGRRADHDQLPAKVQAYYTKNLALYKKIKEGYNELLSMIDAEPCDRYALCKALKKDDDAYRRNWRLYDEYKVKDKK